MRKFLTLFTALMLMCTLAFAQTRTITGTVRDDKGEAIPFATVTETSTRNAVQADANGRFTIAISGNHSLTVTGAGFTVQTINPSGAVQDFTLKRVNDQLSEVVVTALGIRREKKALGYAVSTVNAQQLEQRPEGDITRVLSGKTPGVDIGATSGLSGSGTNITIRGVSTINGNSTPLFVVDGIPFDASTNSQADFRYGNQTSSRFLDIDPNNIESVSVLRGLSATTLYGELGRNGVILITTKNGAGRRTTKKTEISVTQSLYANNVASLPEWQNTYGGGFQQSLGFQFYSNWGAAFTNPPTMVTHAYSRPALALAFPQFQGKQVPFQAYPNNVNDFFRTGLVNTTSINIAGNPGANSTLSANYTYYNDKGFTPGNSLNKNTFGFGGSTKLANNFTLSGSFNFVVTDYKTPPNTVSFGSGADVFPGIFADVMYTPRSVDLMGLPYENPLNGSSVYYRPGNDIQNPNWTAKYVKFRQAVQRTFGQMSLRYDITRNWNILYRIGLDTYGEENSVSSPKGGVLAPLGLYRVTNGKSAWWNHDIITQFSTRLGNNWDLTGTAGFNYLLRKYNQNGSYSTNQLVFNLFDQGNFVNASPRGEDGRVLSYTSQRLQTGAYAEGTFGYKDFFYTTIGARNGWNSTLEIKNNSQFYPSASVSIIPTSAFESLKGHNWLNYTKLRAGYGTSARFPETPYTTRPALDISSNVFVDRSNNQINTNSIPNLLPNPNLKPELLKELEFGLEGKFIKNRLSIDLTYYNRKATNQILFRDIDPSTGYTSQQINGGSVQNKGIELGLGFGIVRSKNFGWNLDINFTRNRSKVLSLPAGVKQLVTAGYTDLGNFAIVGQPLGVMQGSYVQRDPKSGQLIVDGIGNYLSSTGIGIIGNPNPDFKTSFINTISFKGLNFRMQWDYTQGGAIYSTTIRTLLARGLTKDTEFDRLLPVILPGVKQDGTPNDIQTTATNAYFNSIGLGPSDRSVFDGTVIRLRELSLSYVVPGKLFNRLPVGSLSITAFGQNLWYKAPNTPKYMNFDPETSGLGTGSYRGFEFITGPSSRRIGGSIKITF